LLLVCTIEIQNQHLCLRFPRRVVILIHCQVLGMLGGLVFFLEIPSSSNLFLYQLMGKVFFWRLSEVCF
jgi:hypothetical protein